MKSRSKLKFDDATIVRLFERAGIPGAGNITPLGAGEFNSIYAADAGGKAYAVKIAPADASRTLTYETDMMRQEVDYYALMRDRAGIDVPAIYFSDFSSSLIPAPYFIMERIDGTSVDRADLSSSERSDVEQKTAELVAKLHAVRGERFGYRQNGLHDDWHLALSAMVENLIGDCRRFARKTKNGDRLLALVHANRAVLERVESRLINFDAWAPNILCTRKGGALRLVWIDPERSLWGDRIADFVCLEFMTMSLDGKARSLSAYNRVSDAPIAVGAGERIRFALMLGYLGLIMEVEKYARYTPFHFGWWRNVAACRLLFRHCFAQFAESSAPGGAAPIPPGRDQTDASGS